MILLPRTATGRIALAIALSLLAHALLLFAPMIQLAPAEIPLPPLTAKLEPLPKIAAKPAPVKKRKPKPALPKPVVTEQPAVADKVADDQTVQPEAPAEPPPAAEETKPAHPLPKHAQLTFAAYKGEGGMQLGEARHRLDIGDDKSYTLKVGMNTTGIASMFKTFEMNQQSSGTLTGTGLHPNEFSETKNTAKGKEALDAKFDWEAKTLSFSNGNKTSLPDQTQDIISFLYQLSQSALDQGTIPMYISNGKKLERYELAVGEEEEIQTRLGKLRALPLRKVHAPGEEGLDIWLGVEYRLLPVKIRQIDRTGEIAGEMVISDIRVADE